jgi:hypothetical protein
LFKKNEPNEFYNLVYHKVNDSWTTSVFLLKKDLNPNIKNRPFETIEKITGQLKVPNKTQKTAAECFQFYTEIRCDGSCPGACDGLKCEKGVCYYIGIAQVSCGGGFQTSTTPIDYPNTDNNNTGGGSYTDFVFKPNTLKNLDINDPNYVNLWNTVNVWTALDGTEILFFRYDAQNMIFFDATIQYQIDNNWSSESAVIANSLRKAKFENPDSNFDVEASFKSPFNIDKSSIKDVTAEDKKFNSVYEALTDSPAFKKLFLDLFDNNNKRFNVKFEIIENLDINLKKIDGFCKPINQNNVIIQINKQILTSTGLRPMTNIEIAKTILHECVHAYLAIKGKYPDAGLTTIPSVENMTFTEVLKATRPGTGAQHDFMYKNMVPTMQKILTEIRDSVTSSTTRATVESIRLQPNFYTNPKNTILWNWNSYFYYLSLKGLQDTEAFKISFPANTDKFELLLEYNFFGHKHLKN